MAVTPVARGELVSSVGVIECRSVRADYSGAEARNVRASGAGAMKITYLIVSQGIEVSNRYFEFFARPGRWIPPGRRAGISCFTGTFGSS